MNKKSFNFIFFILVIPFSLGGCGNEKLSNPTIPQKNNINSSASGESTDYSPGQVFDTALCKPPQVNNGFGKCI